MTDSIRVVKVATPEEQFQRLRTVLEKKGSLTVKQSDQEAGTYVLSMGFAFRNKLPAYLPYTDFADFTIEYDARTKTWDCHGDVFGVNLKLDHPKLFFTNVRDASENRLHSISQFLLRCEKFWERYRGDLPQFAYKMGVELSNVGTMHVFPDADMTQAHWHQDLDTPFDVWFSKHVLRNHVKPVFLLGFHEDVRLHRFELTQEGVRTLMDSINHHVWWTRSFCDPLIDMF